MGIDFFNLLDDEGWVPLRFDPAISRSTKIDPSFNLIGLRCPPNATIPTHHHNLRQLVIVFGGELLVEFATDEPDSRRVGAGEFFISDAGTPFAVTAGAAGATFTACWPEPVANLRTFWQ